MTRLSELDLFPLAMPILPGCKMPLRIFEPRYLDLISRSMKQNQPFTIVQIKKGRDTQTDDALEMFSVGTQVQVVDFNMTDDRCLAISVEGLNRVELSGFHQLDNKQWVAEGQPLEERGIVPEDDCFLLRDLLEQLLQHDMIKGINGQVNLESNEQVMNYLIMLLPFTSHMKHALIETDNLKLRWQGLIEAISRLEQSAKM